MQTKTKLYFLLFSAIILFSSCGSAPIQSEMAFASVENNNTVLTGMDVSYGSYEIYTLDVAKSNSDIWLMDPTQGVHSLKFNIDEEYIKPEHSEVIVTIEYLDVGTGEFAILYNSYDQAIDISTGQVANIYETGSLIELNLNITPDNAKQTEYIELTDTGEWKTAEFTLQNTYFTNALYDCDFAIINYIPLRLDIVPTTLSIRKITAIATKENTATDDVIENDFSYNMVNLFNNSVVLSGQQAINLKQGQTQTVSLSTNVTLNGYYEFEAKLSGTNETIQTMPLSVMPFYDTQNTLNDIFGVCTHYGHAWFNGDVTLKANLANLMGANWIRDEMNWHRAETEKGVVEILPEWDLFVNEAIAAGLKPILILAYGNPLYDEGGPPYTQEGLDAYANYVSTIVKHFEGRVEHFEVWNEYNLEGTVFNTTSRPPEDYTQMLKTAYTAIKSANPNATVIGGAMAGVEIEWLEVVLANGGGDYMDVLSYHPYSHPNHPEDGGFAYVALELPHLLSNYGLDIPLWATEVGWPITTQESSVTEIEAASYLVRTYVLGIATGMDKVFWYDLINDGTNPEDMEHNFGLLRSWYDSETPLAAKAPYLAYNTVSGKLSTNEYISFTGLTDNVFVGVFASPNANETMLVMWTLDGEAELTLNVVGSTVQVTDIMSNVTTVPTTNNQAVIQLSSSPVFVECTLQSDPIAALK